MRISDWSSDVCSSDLWRSPDRRRPEQARCGSRRRYIRRSGSAERDQQGHRGSCPGGVGRRQRSGQDQVAAAHSRPRSAPCRKGPALVSPLRVRHDGGGGMIRAEDADFHFTPDSHWQWVETIALPFCVPEANINVIVYVVARPMLGVCMADVTILDRISDLWEEQAYIDNQQHMPCPEKLSDFTLPNGLTVKAIDPINHYRVEYQGIDDTWFKLDYHALHTAYDINDPAIDPLAADRSEAHTSELPSLMRHPYAVFSL